MKFIGLVGNYVDLENEIFMNTEPVIVFDIDNTLYKETRELVIERRRAGYKLLHEDLNISFKEFDKLSEHYTKEYGTNYKGFILHHKISPANIAKLNDVYVDLSQFLPKNTNLIKLIKELPFKSYCFTNSNLAQAVNTLSNIGLEECIDYLFYVKYDPNQSILCKPLVRAYEVVDEVINKGGKHKILFFDDNIKNIEYANKFGWQGVEVSNYDNVCDIIKGAVKKYYKFDLK